VRIVLDTNVALSALLWRGTPYVLLEAIKQRQHAQLFVSPTLLEELGDVLNRPMSARRLALIGRAAHEVLADYYDAVEVVTPLSAPPVVAADADDDHVVAAAVAASADLLISGDRHVLALGTHAGVRIVGPAEALRVLEELKG
jgi:putative PIN family toxin of toxin-antitoxin system